MNEQIRQGTYEDKDQVLEISKTIWDGNDFILRTIDEWLDPNSGYVAVLEADGEIRAFSKLSFIPGGHGWLEGLRVKEEHRGKGYANKMTKHLLKRAKEINLPSLRFACHASNLGSIRSGEKYGFQRVGEYIFTMKRNFVPSLSVKKINTLTDGKEAFERLVCFKEYKENGGYLFGNRWKFIPCTANLINEYADAGKIIVTEDNKCMMIYDQDGEDLRILFYGGEIEGVRNLFMRIGKEAQARETKTMTLPGSRMNKIFMELGFHGRRSDSFEDKANVYLYEYPREQLK